MQLDPSPAIDAEPAPLPPGVTRNTCAGNSSTLDDCYAVQLFVTPLAGHCSRSYVIWRTGRSRKAIPIKPLSKKRIRDLRPGDLVAVDGEWTEVVGLEIFR